MVWRQTHCKRLDYTFTEIVVSWRTQLFCPLTNPWLHINVMYSNKICNNKYFVCTFKKCCSNKPLEEKNVGRRLKTVIQNLALKILIAPNLEPTLNWIENPYLLFVHWTKINIIFQLVILLTSYRTTTNYFCTNVCEHIKSFCKSSFEWAQFRHCT